MLYVITPQLKQIINKLKSLRGCNMSSISGQFVYVCSSLPFKLQDYFMFFFTNVYLLCINILISSAEFILFIH